MFIFFGGAVCVDSAANVCVCVFSWEKNIQKKKCIYEIKKKRKEKKTPSGRTPHERTHVEKNGGTENPNKRHGELAEENNKKK